MRSLLFTLLALTLTVHASVLPFSHRRAETSTTNYAGYLFIHFYDDYKSPGDYSTYPAGEQVFGHLSNGNEATSYSPLKGGAPLLTSNVGTKGVRDFYLVSKDDQSKHFIIATDLNQTAAGGFGGKFLSRNLVVWESNESSLTNWQSPRLVEVVPENFRMAWAPEALYLADQDKFMVYWSSNVFSDSQHSGDPDSDKIYYSYTSDFYTFTDPQEYIALPNNVGIIDLTMHPTGNENEYVRFFKDESVSKCRGQVSKNGIFGDWSDIGSSTEYVDNNNQSEACLFFKDNTNDTWWVWLDQYGRNPVGYYPYTADNGITNYGYTDRGVGNGMPSMTKHGAVKPLTQAQYDEVKQNWG